MHILFKRRVCLLTVFFWLSLVSELFSQQTLCPPLTPPLYGTLQDGQCTNLVGSVCNFNCTEGYETIGNTTRVCGENGQWSGREMMCINSNMACPFLNPGGSSSAPSLVGGCLVLAGSRCYFTCPPNHVLVGQDSVFCLSNGQWSNLPPSCEPPQTPPISHTSCPHLHDPPNGQVNALCELTRQRIGIKCHYTCNSNHQLIGSSTVECLNTGEWSAPTPTCLPLIGCPPFTVANAFPLSGTGCSDVSLVETGTVCSIQCMNGFTLIGTAQLNCLPGGNWSSPQPVCQSSGCSPINVVNAQEIGTACSGFTNIQVGTKCSFQCLPGYTLNGASDLYCLIGGVWSSIPTCLIKLSGCPALSVPNARQFGTGCNGVSSTIPVGNTCTFVCSIGYDLVGTRELLCQPDNNWNFPPPACRPAPLSYTCPTLFVSAPLQASGKCANATVGQICSFTCGGNLQLQGQTQLFCQKNGQWSSLMPSCIDRRCPYPPTPMGGTYISEYSLEPGQCTPFCPGIPGQNCRLICANGFRLIGSDSRIFCSTYSLRWEPHTLPTCEQITTSFNG